MALIAIVKMNRTAPLCQAGVNGVCKALFDTVSLHGRR